jgi:N-acetylmuramoyl-L-alanine amidase
MNKPRKVKYIVIHCTATQPNVTVESIKRYWKEVKGWKDVPGYHYLIKPNGEIIKLLDESKNSYGVYAHNNECISISYIGGIDKEGKPKDTRTKAQEHAMFDKIVELTERYPQAEVRGHRDFKEVKKACPSFDVKTWLANYQPDLDSAA